MNAIQVISLTLLSVLAASAQVIMPGRCPQTGVQEDFDTADAPPAPYWVLSTDYENYSLVYSCTDLGVLHFDFAWIMSREPTLSEETLGELQGILSSMGVSVHKLLTTDQSEATCSSMSL